MDGGKCKQLMLSLARKIDKSISFLATDDHAAGQPSTFHFVTDILPAKIRFECFR